VSIVAQQIRPADATTSDEVVRQLNTQFHYLATDARQLVRKYAQTVNIWYTEFVNQEPQHRTIDDVAADIHPLETYQRELSSYN
jgi:cyclopropane fatty-acyl-phospholipid synthase-like methyltransferase